MSRAERGGEGLTAPKQAIATKHVELKWASIRSCSNPPKLFADFPFHDIDSEGPWSLKGSVLIQVLAYVMTCLFFCWDSVK